MRCHLAIILFALMHCRDGALCYNLDATSDAATVLNVSIPGSKINPIYAGYQISTTVSGLNISFILGAPKLSAFLTQSGISNGTIIRCQAKIHPPVRVSHTRPSGDDSVTTRQNQMYYSTTAPLPSYSTAEKNTSNISWHEKATKSTKNTTEAAATHTDATTVVMTLSKTRTPSWISTPVCESSCDKNDMLLNKGANQRVVADGLGSTVVSTSLGENYTICAPGRQKYCAGAAFTPGACYRWSPTTKPEWINWGEQACFLNYLDVVFVVDSSNSISAADFDTMKVVLVDAVQSFGASLGDTTQISILQYGDAYARRPSYSDGKYFRQPLSFGECDSTNCVENKIKAMQHIRAPNTYTALAIERVVKLDFASSANKALSHKYIVLITDGSATDSRRLQTSYQLTKENNITVYAIGVGKINTEQLRISANGRQNNERVLTVADYATLKGTLRSVTQLISRSSAEGQSSEALLQNQIENAAFGFSAHYSNRTQTTFIGAVAAYRFTGSVMKFASQYSRERDMLPYSKIAQNLKTFTTDSYLGYSVTSGNFDGNAVEYLAAGAPRYYMHGAVVLYEVEKNWNYSQSYHLTPYACGSCRDNWLQTGMYFGGSLLSTDVNGDGKDDLLVGAPLYVGEKIDEGRVFVYISQITRSVITWSNASYKPAELYGSKLARGRFGTSMTAAGDLNDDGYNDVAISAPFAEDHQGVVYIYHGSAKGISKDVKQTITASSLGSVFSRLGLSLHGGQDLDGNLYPDLIVGAPASDNLLILRTRPLVRFNNTVKFTDKEIDVLKCYNNHKCTQIEICLYYHGKSVENYLELECNITLDPLLNRIYFGNFSPSFGPDQLLKLFWVKAKQNYCQRFDVQVKDGIEDFDTPLQVSLQHKLPSRHLTHPVSSVEDVNNKKVVVSNSTLHKGCGLDDICQYDLHITAQVVLPTAGNQSSPMLGNDQQPLIIASEKAIKIRVNLTNHGDPAFGTTVSVTYSKELYWKRVYVLSSSNGYKNCINDLEEEKLLGEEHENLLIYYRDEQIKGVMTNESWCFFEVIFFTDGLRDSGTKKNVSITVAADTWMKGQELNTSNNVATFTLPVEYQANVDFREQSDESGIRFNFTSNSNFTVSSVKQIGGTTRSMVVKHEVRGQGYSVIPLSTISLIFPSMTSDKQRLLYLYKLECTETGSVMCSCNQSGVNPLQLDNNSNVTMNNTYTIIPNPNILHKTSFDCTTDKGKRNTVCETVTCTITNLARNNIIQFEVSFRLWRQTLNLPENKTEVAFTTDTVYSSMLSPLTTDEQGNQPIIKRDTTTKRARKYVSSVNIPTARPLWWYYAVAAGCGVLLLGIIVFIMYKTGFFRSKYGDQLEAEKIHEWDDPVKQNVYDNCAMES